MNRPVSITMTDAGGANGDRVVSVAVDGADGGASLRRQVRLGNPQDVDEFVSDVATRFGDEVAGGVEHELQKEAKRGGDDAGGQALVPRPLTARHLVGAYPHLRPPVIDKLLRQGETLNLISGSKAFKTFTVIDLALHVATGRVWLDTFATARGDVLVVDNELHPETLAWRVRKVAEARGVAVDEYGDHLLYEPLRGRLRDIFAMEAYFNALEPGRFRLVVLDALYRFIPAGESENDNGLMANIYNLLDRVGDRLRCAFMVVHHGSKGVQGNKAVTDVGAGAGSQSRATDSHVVLRQHETDGVMVVEAAVRSWPPLPPVCLRWTYPTWDLAPEEDPTLLKREPPRGGRPKKDAAAQPAKPQKHVWSAEEFAKSFVGDTPRSKELVIAKAATGGVSLAQAKALLAVGEDQRLIHRHHYAGDNKAYFATREQLLTDVSPAQVCVSRAPPRTPPGRRRKKRRSRET